MLKTLVMLILLELVAPKLLTFPLWEWSRPPGNVDIIDIINLRLSTFLAPAQNIKDIINITVLDSVLNRNAAKQGVSAHFWETSLWNGGQDVFSKSPRSKQCEFFAQIGVKKALFFWPNEDGKWV